MDEYFNAVAHTWYWTASFGALMCVYGWQLYRIIRDRFRLKRKRKSFETYRDTGQVDETFESLTPAAAEAAGRAHAAVVGRAMVYRSDFTAVVDCPKCGHVDLHHLRARAHVPADRTVIRTCTRCEFEGRQH